VLPVTNTVYLIGVVGQSPPSVFSQDVYFMLALASIEQELNIRTTVAYICCANHFVLMTTPSITALAEGSHRLTAVL